MSATLRQISDQLNRLVILVSVGLVLTMLTMSSLGIFYQFVLDDPLTWSYSLTRLFLPWFALLSLTVAFKSGEHVAISLAVRRLPVKAFKAVQIFSLFVVALYGIAMAWYGFDFFLDSTQLYMVSDTFQVSHKWVAASVPVSGVIICLHLMSGLSLVEHHDILDEAEP